uniref:Uncharacterized protein n=1 Tax=Glossina austeni TaxID=7395 RepID=A0A1A9UQ37_GLOAU
MQDNWLPPMSKNKCFHKKATNIPATKTVMRKKLANNLIRGSFQFMAAINPCIVCKLEFVQQEEDTDAGNVFNFQKMNHKCIVPYGAACQHYYYDRKYQDSSRLN